MTSIICWENKGDYFPGLWGVSDSRVSSVHGILTDNAPKLFPISVNAYERGDVFRQNPKRILNFIFGYAGNTIIGTNVKDILIGLLSNLQEMTYCDAPDYPFFERTPTLAEIMKIAAHLGEVYLKSVGFTSPLSAKCEFIIYGYCRKSNEYKAFHAHNDKSNPTTIFIREEFISDEKFLVLGDKRHEVREMVLAKREMFDQNSINWRRTPLIVMADLLRLDGIETIGGFMQLWVATKFDNRYVSISHDNQSEWHFAGFN